MSKAVCVVLLAVLGSSLVEAQLGPTPVPIFLPRPLLQPAEPIAIDQVGTATLGQEATTWALQYQRNNAVVTVTSGDSYLVASGIGAQQGTVSCTLLLTSDVAMCNYATGTAQSQTSQFSEDLDAATTVQAQMYSASVTLQMASGVTSNPAIQPVTTLTKNPPTFVPQIAAVSQAAQGVQSSAAETPPTRIVLGMALVSVGTLVACIVL